VNAALGMAGTLAAQPDPRARLAVAHGYPPPAALAPPQEGTMSQPRPSAEVLLTRLPDGSGVLLHLGTKFYYTLNRTGVVAWEVVSRAQAIDPEAIVDAIEARFAGVARGQARSDVERLLRDLEAEGLLAPER
jgi:hypothetical protein